MRTAQTCKRIYGGSPSLPSGSRGWRRNIRYRCSGRGGNGSIRLSFLILFLFITIIIVDYLQILSIFVARQLRFFPERLEVLLALEHLFRYLCRRANVMSLVLRVSIPGFVVDVWVGGDCGASAGVGCIGQYRVVCLSDGILDETRCGGFVDYELACSRCVVITEWMNNRVQNETRTFGRILSILDFIEILSYSVL
jgi:hypothetical protein